ncbi:flagellar M-ring protein FliF C-terminal domain-containing protein [Achromobacter insuavis]
MYFRTPRRAGSPLAWWCASVVQAEKAMRARASMSIGAGAGADNETDYQAGRKVEEIVSTPGVIMKMGVTAVVRGNMDGVALERVKALVGTAAGAQVERGDTVIVYSTEQVAARGGVMAQDAGMTVARAAEPPVLRTEFEWTPRLAIALLLALGGVGLVLLLLLGRRRMQAPRLSADQRDVLLQQLRGWLEPGKPTADAEKR